MQKLAPGGRKILTVWRFERALQRDVFHFRSFSTFRETTSERAMRVMSHGAYCASVMQRNDKTNF